ncbi:MAG: DNA (cytosine-5-)-methyltransferase [Mycoplasma sp.]
MKVFETFSGIGAQHKALEIIKEKFGYQYDVVATSEWDIDAIISYAAIHYPKFETQVKLPKNTDDIYNYLSQFTFSTTGKEPILNSRLIKLPFEKIAKLYKAHVIGNNIGSIVDIKAEQLINKTNGVDLITYSFPCQDLSVAGSFWGFNQGMKKDSETRSSLLWEIGRLVDELKDINHQPKFLLLENVPNMISARHIDDYIIWKKHLYDLGYKTKTYVLNSFDYGIPQIRKRVYAVSVLDLNNEIEIDEKYEIIDKTYPRKEGLIKPDEIKTKSLKDIIKNDYSIEKYYIEAVEARPRRTPSRKKMFELNYQLNKFDRYSYIRTLTTRQDRHPNAGVVDLHGTIFEQTGSNSDRYANYRFLTTREAYLFMGFEEIDYERARAQGLTSTKLYQQAGNSIVVNAILVVLKLIQEKFNG